MYTSGCGQTITKQAIAIYSSREWPLTPADLRVMVSACMHAHMCFLNTWQVYIIINCFAHAVFSEDEESKSVPPSFHIHAHYTDTPFMHAHINTHAHTHLHTHTQGLNILLH